MYYKATKPRRWTETTKECLSRGCICEGCNINDMLFKDSKGRCQGKAAVMESVRILGRPEDIEGPTILDDEVKND